MDDTATLGEARQWLRERLADGAPCPCCTQRAQMYHRKLNSSAVFGLIEMYRAHHLDWGHAPSTSTVSRVGGELARCRYWGLLEESDDTRPDGGRAGWWRVTTRGQRFIFNDLSVPSHVYIYDNRLMSTDDRRLITCREALGRRFDYNELIFGLRQED